MKKGSWRYIEENDQSASMGLATDEFLTNSFISGPGKFSAALRLYQYRDFTALCGRFQHIDSEIDLDFCKDNGFTFSRRLTGGGAIIMGEDQLGICIATHADNIQWNKMSDIYHLFAEPLLSVLQELGIDASFRAKNDLEVKGKKIAGLGVYMSPEGAVQFHCSLLFKLDIPKMLQLLKVPAQKYSDKVMVRSVEQRMTTVTREAPGFISMDQLKQNIRSAYAEAFNIKMEPEAISEKERKGIEDISKNKYLNEEWVFQQSPQKDMTGMSLKKTNGGLIRTYVGLKGENIKSVLITGDFMDKPEAFSEIESLLKWSVLDERNVSRVIQQATKEKPLPENITNEELYEAIWMAVQRAHAAHKYTYKGSCYYPKTENAQL